MSDKTVFTFVDPYSSPRKDKGVETIPVWFTGFTIILPGEAPVVMSIPGLLESIVTGEVKLFNSNE